MKYLPTSVEPVNTSASTSGCRPSARPACSPSPGTTFSTPGGKPASSASSARRNAENGDCSAGLSTTLLPAASAGASFQAAMSSGKFHGTTAAITPNGSRVMVANTFAAVGATWSYSLSRLSPYQANTWAAPGTSMFQASITGLPMLNESSSASSSRWASINCDRRSNTALRSIGAMRAQGPWANARRALRTARSTSCSPQAATSASTWPVAGLITANRALSTASQGAPSISAVSIKRCRAARAVH
ncbi:hypothetical protein D3C85_804880 [compost metagenome]